MREDRVHLAARRLQHLGGALVDVLGQRGPRAGRQHRRLRRGRQRPRRGVAEHDRPVVRTDGQGVHHRQRRDQQLQQEEGPHRQRRGHGRDRQQQRHEVGEPEEGPRRVPGAHAHVHEAEPVHEPERERPEDPGRVAPPPAEPRPRLALVQDLADQHVGLGLRLELLDVLDGECGMPVLALAVRREPDPALTDGTVAAERHVGPLGVVGAWCVSIQDSPRSRERHLRGPGCRLSLHEGWSISGDERRRTTDPPARGAVGLARRAGRARAPGTSAAARASPSSTSSTTWWSTRSPSPTSTHGKGDHGLTQVLTLGENSVDVVIVAGIGHRPLLTCLQAGMRVFAGEDRPDRPLGGPGVRRRRARARRRRRHRAALTAARRRRPPSDAWTPRPAGNRGHYHP